MPKNNIKNKKTPMTKKEQRAVREWVKDGHSVYENPCGAMTRGTVTGRILGDLL